jgi:hypothetical protein
MIVQPIVQLKTWTAVSLTDANPNASVRFLGQFKRLGPFQPSIYNRW